jgi:hypothetical protein
MPLLHVSIPKSGLSKVLNLRHVAVDQLQEANTSLICEDIEGLRFNVGVIQSGPFQVLLGQLGVCRFARVPSNGLNGIRAILGLLGTGYGGQPGDL